MTELAIDRIRRAALDRIEKSRKRSVMWLVMAGVFEALMFVAIVFTINVDDRTHLLIFFCSCLVYGPLALGLFALRAYVDLSAQRVLKAVELSGADSADA